MRRVTRFNISVILNGETIGSFIGVRSFSALARGLNGLLVDGIRPFTDGQVNELFTSVRRDDTGRRLLIGRDRRAIVEWSPVAT